MASGGKISSGRGLAAALAVGESTVREYLGRADWPVRRSPPWSAAELARIKAWRQTLQEDRSETSAATATLEKGLKLERMLKIRAERKRIEGQFIERGLVDAALEALTRLFVGALNELERALPTQLAGLDPPQIERLVHERLRIIRSDLAERRTLELAAIDEAAKKPKARGRPAARR